MEINTVTTLEDDTYKIATSDAVKLFVPKNEENKDYRELLQWVSEGGVIDGS